MGTTELTKAQLMANFSHWLNSHTHYTPLPHRSLHSVLRTEHRFYPIRQYDSLIKLMQLITDDSHQFMGRYIVTTERRMLVAREGEPGFFIPTHLQMSRHKPVLAAGNFFFNAKGEITAFNHDCPDFETTVESLVWPLIITELMNASLAESFHLISHVLDQERNMIPKAYVYLSQADRQALRAEISKETRDTIQEDNQDTQVILCENDALERYQIRPPFTFKGGMFAHRRKNEEETTKAHLTHEPL